MNPSDGFGHDYPAARRCFLEAAREAGADLIPFENPSRGPDGVSLVTDVAWIGPAQPRRVLLTLSGNHGVEGIAGSGIQVASLRGGLHRVLPPETALVHVHAINPYGFAWLRRCNEDGVDICRNFMDFEAPRPESVFYQEFAQYLVPEIWEGPEREAADARLYGFVGEHGVDRFTAELARGQYEFDFAPFFGGRAPSWSNRTTREIFTARLAGVEDLWVIDYHTGLGERGTGQLLGYDHPSDPGNQRARETWGAKYVPIAAEESVAYAVTGDIVEPLVEMFPNASVQAAAYEFGTVDAVSVLQAIRGDHWLHAHGDPASPLAAEIKDQIRSAFYCEDPVWHRDLVEQSDAAHREALAAIAR